MCAPILRSIGTKLTNVENMKNRKFYLTSRDAKRYVNRHGDFGIVMIGIFIRNILLPVQKLWLKQWF